MIYTRYIFKTAFFACLLLGFGALSLNAQKFAYVDTKYILEMIPEYQDAQRELNQLSTRWQREIETKLSTVEQLRQAYEAEKILLTEEMKRQRLEDIDRKYEEARELQTKRFGLNGELFKKRQELIQPIQERVYGAIKEIAKAGNFAIIFDRSSNSNVLFADERYDRSDRVLRKLGIKIERDIDDDL
ncbi:MAG: OmpH family outer membrane protein [Luteibaculaceae bacterium]